MNYDSLMDLELSRVFQFPCVVRVFLSIVHIIIFLIAAGESERVESFSRMTHAGSPVV